MLGRLLTVGITLFWVTMMTLLVEREMLPAWRVKQQEARTPSYARLEALAEKGQTRQMGIYRGEPPERRGRSLSTLKKAGPDVVMTSDTRIALNLPDGEMPFRFQFEARVIAGQLSSFHLNVFLLPTETGNAAGKSSATPQGPRRGDSKPWAVVDGRRVGDFLKVKIQEGGETQQLPLIPFDSRQMLSDLFSPTFTPAQLRVGESWSFSTFNPISRSVGTSKARVTGRERIKLDGAEEDAFVIRVTSGLLEATVWVNRQGEVVKEKILGFILLRERPDGGTAE